MELFIYLFKINVAIILFYFIYRLIFQQDTFFAWKRVLLLSMVVFAFIYPLFDLSGWFVDNANFYKTNSLPTISIDTAMINFSVAETRKTISFTEIVLLIAKIIYFSGVIFIFLKIFGQIFSVLSILKNSEKQNIFQNQVLVSENINAPFSFFGKIIFNPKNYSESEINEILLHENSHVRQLHSFDTMIAEILCAFAWFNPFAWLLKREIRLNLEFLADKNVMSAGCELQNYQFNLLKISCQNRTKITNNFNFSPVKKRIIMLKKNQTKSAGILKYALLLPIFAILFGVNQLVMSQSQEKSHNPTFLSFEQWKEKIKVTENIDTLPQFSCTTKKMLIQDENPEWWQPILKKHNLQLGAYNNFGNIIEWGMEGNSINNGICTLKAAIVLIKNGDTYDLIEADTIHHNIQEGVLEVIFGVRKVYKMNSDLPDMVQKFDKSIIQTCIGKEKLF